MLVTRQLMGPVFFFFQCGQSTVWLSAFFKISSF